MVRLGPAKEISAIVAAEHEMGGEGAVYESCMRRRPSLEFSLEARTRDLDDDVYAGAQKYISLYILLQS